MQQHEKLYTFVLLLSNLLLKAFIKCLYNKLFSGFENENFYFNCTNYQILKVLNIITDGLRENQVVII